MNGPVFLFEKLVDESPEELFERKKTSTFSEFQDSIAKDLSRLLNTKVATLWRNNPITTPYAYGANVSMPTSVESVFETQELQSQIDKAITLFEPRLIDAKSTILGIDGDPSHLLVNIEAIAILENRKTTLSFPIAIEA
jgi:type VI secretion system lysozyme-like protein